MRTLIHAVVAVSVALMPIGYAEAAKRVHKTQKMHYTPVVRNAPVNPPYVPAGDANSMSGSNSATENAIGRTNCC